jgi:hypothetical protein
MALSRLESLEKSLLKKGPGVKKVCERIIGEYRIRVT